MMVLLQNLSFHILEQEDGGLSLSDLAEKFNRELGPGPRSKILKTREIEFIKIFYSMENLFVGLHQMNQAGYYHKDIKSLNIVARPKGNMYDIRFIDWGLATYGRNWNYFGDNMYFVRPPEIFVFSEDQMYNVNMRYNRSTDKGFAIRGLESNLEYTYNGSYAKTILSYYFVDGGRTVDDSLNPYLNVKENLGKYVDLIKNGTPQELNAIKKTIIQKSDVFSVGIVLIHMWSEILNIAFQPDSNQKFISRHHVYPKVLEEIHKLILNMCCKTLDHRYTPAEAYSKFSEIKDYINRCQGLAYLGTVPRATAVVPPSANQERGEVPLVPLANQPRAVPVARKNCKKYRKTVNPKCNDQEGCTWVVRKGCLNKELNPENVPLVAPAVLADPVPIAVPVARQEANPKIYIQNKPCNPGKVFNPLTGYCIKSNGALAKKLRKEGIIN